MRHLALLLISFLVFGCGGGRGLAFDEEGQITIDSPGKARERSEALFAEATTTAAGCPTEVHLDTNPHWREEGRRHDEGWYWNLVKAEIVAHPDRGTALDHDRITDALRTQLAPAVIGGEANLAVVLRVEVAVPAGMPPSDAATTTDQAPAMAPAMAPAIAPVVRDRSYTIQPGDTLAEISSVFYGSPQHWRRLVSANPGLDPGHLELGRTIEIPPAP